MCFRAGISESFLDIVNASFEVTHPCPSNKKLLSDFVLGFQGSAEASASNPTNGSAANMERVAKIKELEFKMNKRMLVHRLAK